MKVFLHIFIDLLVLSSFGYAQFNIFDISNQLLDAARGVFENLPSLFSSPDDFIDLSKNIIFGYPSEIAIGLVHQFCSVAVSTRSVNVREKYTPNLESLTLILKTKHLNISARLTNPSILWSHKEFRTDLPLVLFVSGWQTDLMVKISTAQETMYEAYACRGNVNFVVLDTGAFVDTLYTWAAFNTESIGQYLGSALKLLAEKIPHHNIHLIGHSLGAHICSVAGRRFYELTQKILPRITGLDPASPCFKFGEKLSGLFRGDAQFVDVIHTNPGVLGKRDAVGDLDFFCNGLTPLQPGCMSIPCSHGRAWKYYAETVYPGNEANFLAIECTSMKALNSNYCRGKAIPMGFAAPNTSKGNFFLKTRSKSPYGMYSKPNFEPVCNENSEKATK